jgi:hypothetical protein
MSANVYTVQLLFKADGFEFAPAPLSCCDCPKGLLLCSHMIASLVTICLIQTSDVSFATFFERMPESVRELQMAGITIEFVNSDEQYLKIASSNSS